MEERADVLIVEDEPVVVRAARRILEADGLSVVSVEDGNRGLALVTDGPYGVVLCDLMLPGATGLKVLEGARSAASPSLVIMITGYATVALAREAMSKGAFDVIAKPFRPNDLRKVIANAARELGFEGKLVEEI